jgi:polyadenylate-binding protein
MNEHGESKGYGFVHFEFQKSAEEATKTINDMPLGQKKVFVGPFIPRKIRNQQLETSWTNVYVKDIDPEVTDEQFEATFAAYGKVTSPVIVRKDGQQQSFYGFVNFENHEDATKAVQALNGSKIGNKEIFCCRAQKKLERTLKLRKEWEQTKSSKYQGINLYIKNLEDDIDEDRLKKEFSQFGNVVSHKISAEDGQSKGFGFVCFSTPEEAMRAIAEMHGRVLTGCTKPLYVALHEPAEIRKAKLAQRHATKGRPGTAPQPGAPAAPLYGAPVFYPSGGAFPYPPQALIPPLQPRAWPQQYTQAMPPSYMVPRGVTARPPRGGGQRGGGARGTKGPGRPLPEGVPVSGEQPFTLQFLSHHTLEQQKLFLGERLYPLIAQSKGELAGKITGMFLDSGWSIEELYSLLMNEQKLAEKIEDAVNVLEKAQGDATKDNLESA